MTTSRGNGCFGGSAVIAQSWRYDYEGSGGGDVIHSHLGCLRTSGWVGDRE